jgi:hypothetical protein
VLEQALVLLPVSFVKLDWAVTFIELLVTNRRRRGSKGLGPRMEDLSPEIHDRQPRPES